MLSNMSLGHRLTGGFACLVAMLVAVAGAGALEAHNMQERLRRIVEVDNARARLASTMLNRINELAVQARSITLMTDVREIDAEAKMLEEVQAGYHKAERELAALTMAEGATPEEARAVEEIWSAARKTLPLIGRAARQGQDGASIEATVTLMSQVRPNELLWRKKVARLIALEEEYSQARYAEARAAQRRALVVAWALTAAAVALGTLLTLHLTRTVKRPIDRVVGVAERIAQGDLASNFGSASRDEFGRLTGAITAMQDRLRELVTEIRRSADGIHIASAEVARGNSDLSVRTERAAGNLQSTASSMEQLSVTVRQTADAAQAANELAAKAASIASSGGRIMIDVVSTMDQIHASSMKISEIVAVIDGMAFQTNLLALNAAVEASHAGEQGRGFAVVAGEVRGLAKRSAEAAQEIKALIDMSTHTVEAGLRLVHSAGATMNEIVAGVYRVTGVISEITAATSEQSGSINRINGAVHQLDRMTQENAALVEQSSAAADALHESAMRLAGVVASFHLLPDETEPAPHEVVEAS